MYQRLLRLHGCIYLVALTLSLIPAMAGAQCTNGITLDYVSDSGRAFGWAVLSGDTLLARGGSSFLIDCDAHLTNIKVTLKLPTSVNRETEPLAAGDIVRCEIFDENKTLIMTETVPVPDVGPTALVTFPFWDREFRLSAGQYYFMVSPVDHRWGLVVFGEDYPDGAYQEDFGGFWNPIISKDALFSTVWNPDSDLVATEARRFGGIKAMYR